MLKLHKQFGHASANYLENSLKQAGMIISNKIDKINIVVTHCNTCELYKKPVT